MSGEPERQGRKGARHHVWLPRVTVAAVVVVALLCVASYLQIRDLERGLLSVVAEQQDGYVELVVGQINLRENRDDRKIVEDILGVLDENASRYWTFARNGTMLFVKDVNETNRYKGLPTGSYFDDQSAREFYDGLSADHVTHAYVQVEGGEYIASGRAFRYKKGTYRLCLLTNESVVLDNNQLLGAKSRLGALLGLEAALLLFSTLALALGRDRKSRELDTAQAEVAELTAKLDEADELMSRERSFDLEGHVWGAEALEQFEESLARRGRSARLAQVTCANADDTEALLARMHVLFGDEVARFRMTELSFCALFLDAGDQAAHELLADVLGDKKAQVKWKTVGNSENGEAHGQEEA